MQPQAITVGVQVERSGEVSVFRTAQGAVCEVPAVVAAVWSAADGRTDVQGLLAAARAVEPTATTRLVWDALDSLADAGLLVRSAPPAAGGLDRRTAIRTLVAAAGAAVAILPGVARSEAAAAPEAVAKVKKKADEEEKKKAHNDFKRREETVKADLGAAKLKAEEETAKLQKAAPADIAARKKSEEESKAQVTLLETKAREEQKKFDAANAGDAVR
jgi:hypothetical protein